MNLTRSRSTQLTFALFLVGASASLVLLTVTWTSFWSPEDILIVDFGSWIQSDYCIRNEMQCIIMTSLWVVKTNVFWVSFSQTQIMCCFLYLSLDVCLFNFLPFFLLYLTLLGNVMYHMIFEWAELHLMPYADRRQRQKRVYYSGSIFTLFCQEVSFCTLLF